MRALTVRPGEVAITYSSATDILLTKVVPHDTDPPITIMLRDGEEGFVVDRSLPYHDEACWQYIADHTGHEPLTEADWQCAVMRDGKVEIQRRCPVFEPRREDEQAVFIRQPPS